MGLDDLLAQARPVTRTVRLCLRGDLITQRQQLEQELAAARAHDEMSTKAPTAPAVAKRLRKVEAEQDAAAVVFEVRSIGHRAWDELLDRFPPTEADKERGWGYSAGFPSAAIAASTSARIGDQLEQVTVEQVAVMFEKLSDRQYTNLWATVVSVNTGADDIPKSEAATAVLSGSG
jgi:hypothetical protein